MSEENKIHNQVMNRINLGIDYGIASTIITSLSNLISKNIYRGEITIEATMGKYDVADHIKKIWPNSVISTLLRTEYYVWIYDDSNNLEGFVNVIDNSDREKFTKFGIDAQELRQYQIDVYSERDFVVSFIDQIEKLYPKEKEPKLQWHYLSEGRHQVKEMALKDNNILFDEYYPVLKNGVENFINEYMASTAPVLILLGPPGTGKTSLLRHMIYSRKLHAAFTYEEDLYNNDRFFMNCLVDSSTDILILEDSDVLLSGREKEGNKIMNKLLNVSDGIVKVTTKKIIFTTNLKDVSTIDPALLRPGRCFGHYNFDELTQEQANAAADKAKRPHLTGNNKYPLSNIFNQTQEKATSTLFKMGFI